MEELPLDQLTITRDLQYPMRSENGQGILGGRSLIAMLVKGTSSEKSVGLWDCGVSTGREDGGGIEEDTPRDPGTVVRMFGGWWR